MKETNNFYKNIYNIHTKNTENDITKQIYEQDEEIQEVEKNNKKNHIKISFKNLMEKLIKKIKNASKVQKIAMVWGCVILALVLIIVIRSSLSDYSKGNNKGGLVDELSSCIDEMETILETGMTEGELLALRVETEKKEEKYVPKKLKTYKNDIQTEETAFRMQPGQERSINVTLNKKGEAKVHIKSKSEDVSIIENDVLDINEENSCSQFVRFKLKVKEDAKVNTRAQIELSAMGLCTRTIDITIEEPAKDTENIEMYYDMVPGMTFSTDFILSIITNQEEQFLEHTAKIKNYAKDVMVKKAGEIRAWNIGDAVVTIKYQGKDYKVYVRVREEEMYTEHNKEVTSIHFINPITETMEVGDEYSLIAITLPFMHTKENDNYYDKSALYESSDTNVCSVTYGVVRAEGPGTCTITAYDKNKTVSTSIKVKVVKKKEKVYDKVFEVTPNKAREYGLSDTDGKSTVDGFRKIVADAKSQGKNKVYFTEPLELVMEPYGEEWRLICLNSETMYDFNEMHIKIISHEATPEWGYHLFVMEGVHDTVVKNLNITGNKPKGGCSISFPDAVDCTIEGCNLGYNYWNIATYSAYYDADKMKDVYAKSFEFGNIRSDGSLGDSKSRVRSDFLDISYIDEDEDFMVGNYTEFGHYGNCPSILYDIAYYDKDKKFIKKESCHAQFFEYYKPAGAMYCRLVFHTDELPIDGDETNNHHGLYTGYCIKIGHVKRGYKCIIKDNVLHNATHVNLVFCGEQRCIVEGNYFYMDGDIGCDIDWEDFFQAKSCDIVRDNVFTTRYDSFACVSGLGYVFRNNAFYHQAYVNITGGTRLFRMFGNVFRNIPSRMQSQYDSLFNNNIMGNTFYFFRHEAGDSHTEIGARLRVENNTVYNY